MLSNALEARDAPAEGVNMNSKRRDATLLERLQGIAEERGTDHALKVARGLRDRWTVGVYCWYHWTACRAAVGAVALAIVGAAATALFEGWLG